MPGQKALPRECMTVWASGNYSFMWLEGHQASEYEGVKHSKLTVKPPVIYLPPLPGELTHISSPLPRGPLGDCTSPPET